MLARRQILIAGLLGLCTAAPGWSNMIITPTYDASINNDPNAAIIKNAIQSAIQDFENVILNNITVSIYFREGGGLGGSAFFLNGVQYTTFYNGLVANDANPAAIAALQANGGNAGTNGGLNPVTGNNLIDIKSANARALGINIGPQCVPQPNGSCAGGAGTKYDGAITLNTSITFPPQPNGAPNFGLIAVAEHEIDEVLGLGSSLKNCDTSAGSGQPAGCNSTTTSWTFANAAFNGSPAPEDLFRWTAATGGVRSQGTNCQTPTSAFFAYGPNTGAISGFNNSCNGADFSDWSSDGTARTQDAFATPGANPTLGGTELAALSAIGYDIASPEPGTLLLLASGLALAAFRKRGRI